MFTKNIRKSLLVVLIVVFAISACSPVGNSARKEIGISGTISISGAFALYPLMTRWAEEFTKIYPDVQFDVSAGGAGKGMTDALSGAVDIGMVSREIKPEEESQGAYWVSVTKDAVFPMISNQNPVLEDITQQGISQEVFTKIYITGEITTWGEVVGKPEITDKIHVYTRSDAAGAPEVWAKYLGGLQEDLLGIGVSGDPGLLEAVIKDPLGIGFNNLGYAFDNGTGQAVLGSVVIPIDIDMNGSADDAEKILTKEEAVDSVASGFYPSPPARDLNLVTKGKPSDVVNIFMRWILTDGQAFVGEAGYVSLPQDQLDQALKKLD
ncbi:MAG: phosphate ABC transporter substrate-binding protein [Chloroflexi bacterium HGW-Chloroflexi-10]|nr:MAG: phosphate ABC transporter substrate-binding protein [Chloroflexi bacterium HGW-Chloroflexi-10]